MSNEIQNTNDIQMHSSKGVCIQTMDDLYRFSGMVVKSGLACKDDNVSSVSIKIAMGMEVGLAPLQSVQNIAVINGRPTIYGDAMIGLVQASGLLEEFTEWLEGEGEALTAYCRVQRTGYPPITRQFSWADARRASLNKKSGPWQEYPARMLQMRCRSWGLRDMFADVLKGLIAAEEAHDIPQYDADVSVNKGASNPVPPPPAASRVNDPDPDAQADPARVTAMLAAYANLGYDEATVLEIAGVQTRDDITVDKLNKLREAYRELKVDGVATATEPTEPTEPSKQEEIG